MNSSYSARITSLAPAEDPAYVEAWMRLKHPILDGLSAEDFAHEVTVAVACIRMAGLDESDELARSFGFEPASERRQSSPPQ